MKTLKCEVCGSPDIIKEDGVFVCRGCGMKYSLAEARKMLFADEKVVESAPEPAMEKKAEQPISAPLEKEPERARSATDDLFYPTDNRTLIVARRAKLKEDWTEASRLYSALEEEDPTSIEAFFYAAYSKARSAMTDADLYRRQAAFKVLEKSIQLIPENFDIRKEKEQAVLLRKISADVLALDKVPFVYNERKNGNGKVLTSDKLETITMLNNLNAIMIKALAGVYEKYGEEKSKAIYLFECRLAHFDHLINVGRLGDPSRRLWVSGAQALHQSWNAIDPSHVIPQQEEPEEPPAEEGKKKKRRLSGVAIFFIIFGAIATVIGTIGMAVGFFYLLLS